MTATDPRLTPAQAMALQGLAQFPLVAALLGRRSRRFALGDEIPTAAGLSFGPRPAAPDRAGAAAGAGGDGRHHRRHAITRNARYAPHLANYAGGRPGAPRRRPGSIPWSCSSPMTPGSGSSPPATPAPWSTWPPRR